VTLKQQTTSSRSAERAVAIHFFLRIRRWTAASSCGRLAVTMKQQTTSSRSAESAAAIHREAAIEGRPLPKALLLQPRISISFSEYNDRYCALKQQLASKRALL
jgi:hypothetical protein